MGKAAEMAGHFKGLAACLEEGKYAAVSPELRLRLATFFVAEVRKGAYKPIGAAPQDLRADFRGHLEKAFLDPAELKVVIDYQRELLVAARVLKDKPHPIGAVVLFATWMEHWLNVQLIAKAQKCGRTAKEADEMIGAVGFRAKIGWLWQLLELPVLPAKALERLKMLNATRNKFLHYRWEGGEPEVVLADESQLSKAIKGFDAIVKEMHIFEADAILKDEVATAARIFDVGIRDHLVSLYD